MEKYCNDCKFKLTKYSDVKLGNGYLKTSHSSPVLGDMYVKCKVGNNQTILDWWLKNGKSTIDQIQEVECDKFNQTDGAKLLDDMIDGLDKLKKLLDEQK